MKNNKLIFIADILETKLRKEKELQFYQEELEKLQKKMFFIQKDIEITNTIIKLIENESIYDIEENMVVPLIGKKDDE